MVTVSRIAKLRARRPEFDMRFFTANERAVCGGVAQRWAARWAAKEAVRKLAGSAGLPLPPWRDIEVRTSQNGAPSAQVAGWSRPVAISLTHDGDLAVAIAASNEAPVVVGHFEGVQLPARVAGAHKGTFGRVIVAAGSRSFSGAAYLAAMGAARGGAGLVQLLVPESIYQVVASKCSEVIVTPVTDEEGGFNRDLWRWIDKESRASSLVVGCGWGQTNGAHHALVEIAQRFALPMVLDADALNIAAAKLFDWKRRPGPTVLTPHPAEMARLCGTDVATVQANRVRMAQDLAARKSVFVVLKGADAVVAAPDGRLYVADYDVVALASGGSGDVFAGVCGAMLAQGLEPFEAAVAAVVIHAEAGMDVQRKFGRSGAVASDLLEVLPQAQERIRVALEAIG